MNATLRPTEPRDLPAITAIYAHHVRTGLASFETEAPDEAEMRRRYESVRAKGFPYLTAEIDGVLVGYAYASLYRERFAYRFTLEDSLYMHPEFRGKGIGRLLLTQLIADCEKAGCRQLIAVIGDSANAASIGIHSALGFRMVGTFRAVGWKHERWVDTVHMQRAIGVGDTQSP
jgi:L-amino acid N-acyltransferase YncA